jgi:hypothetical protein
MQWTPEKLKERVAALPEDVRTTIICDVAWSFFGDLDDDGEEYIDTGRRPDSPDLTAAVDYLREELTKMRSEEANNDDAV